eukprot:TRINITY_DN55373_c0_g1_i1.p1 TRINITY_DN55373_c0_g1~~TRINITY_DN55373_c0_g1_i1.p1  ORF type:complete len:223 (-),score=97.61 TRINITY_DN55373_c0_g1_i1:48-716(-)
MAESYPLATEDDFVKFVKAADATENWKVCYDGEECKVWDQTVENSPINIVKLYCEFKDISAIILYDVLHDPKYRQVWDDKMVEGYNIVQLGKHDDIGYYSAKAPIGVSNRDWVNQRSWKQTADGKEFIIMNHSVVHPNAPEKKGFVRANSILTGYLVRSTGDNSCSLTYLTQNDPKGWIPGWLSNTVTRQFAPSIVQKLYKAAKGYDAWKSKNNPEEKPWRD